MRVQIARAAAAAEDYLRGSARGRRGEAVRHSYDGASRVARHLGGERRVARIAREGYDYHRVLGR